MECPQCNREIKSQPQAELTSMGGTEMISIYLTCENCQTEMYTAIRATELEEI